MKQIKGLLFYKLFRRADITRQFGVSPSLLKDNTNRKTRRYIRLFDFDDLFVDRDLKAT